MEDSAYIGSTLAGLVYFALGVRLLRLGLRAGSAPERLLGLAFLLWSLFYALRTSSIALQGQPALESQASVAGNITDDLGCVSFAFFPLLAFRRGSTWAKWLATGIAICLLTGGAGSISVRAPSRCGLHLAGRSRGRRPAHKRLVVVRMVRRNCVGNLDWIRGAPSLRHVPTA
ncbi:MAG TPA: hypothetical protein VGB31_06030, partial [Myxococcota bacterium]